ncbi:MaoC family dehydratase N-terminal domain-containing protein [Terricaulis silvestris]|uniref:(3R)-hydroxyacyl-ACP dehydratase subunit HadC n=1 Tax=Terricaulis silvestris TaxID=2686094 RepID=A0A6I6MNF1_9CAUL|nr:MaoC family dehydratase N-terminal domain-containing protein [Terricaulis silvestris]QGZ96219.1 (3R)-hydroxyacyl-ACP dehydratase subunit HadC [Terricaulis silvestris]
MLDKGKIGAETEEREIAVEAGMLALFCQAVGETNPIYRDQNAARDAGYRAIPTPPTYASVLANLAPAKIDLVIGVLGADLGRMLHGEQSFTQVKPIYVGDRIRLRQRIIDIYDKKGGALEFVVLETSATNQDDELCATMRTVAVLRN